MSSCGTDTTENCVQKNVAIVESLLFSVPVLLLDGVELAPLQLASRLVQGYLASCMLYIIRVDPLLPSLQQTPHISGVSGFVDDWSMGCHGLPAISAVSKLIHDFDQAWKQQINRGNSASIPVRQLSEDERASCLALWYSDIRVSSRERVIGVFIGIHVSIHDQYYNAVHKFGVVLSVFSSCAIVSMHRRGVHFLSFRDLRDLVLVSFHCPWLMRCCPTTTTRPGMSTIANSRSYNLQI